jgi:hypothetical protein
MDNGENRAGVDIGTMVITDCTGNFSIIPWPMPYGASIPNKVKQGFLPAI